jgi:hypothetical protein
MLEPYADSGVDISHASSRARILRMRECLADRSFG